MVRKIDDLGRVVIPMEFRRQLGWHSKDEIFMNISENQVILKRVVHGCIICHSQDNNIMVDEVPVCEKCIKKAAKVLNDDNN